TPENVYQPAHKDNRNTLFEIVKTSHLPGSTILGEENIVKLSELASQGKTCIILSQHLSNLDVPSMFVRFYDHPNPKMKDIFEKIIFVAGVKLNETPLVKLFSEMFSRIVLVPLSSMAKMKSQEEMDLAKRINIAATRKLAELRKLGYIFLMYPAGTRYRPWKPETKKGIKETVSYINSFDYFCCCSINGNNMPPKEHEDMTREQFVDDTLVFNFGEIKDSKQYIAELTNSQNLFDKDDKENIKQYIVDKIMDEIDVLNDN
ncbi:MAG TPA: 1-acyl-sn-glycerol-3-phosphate acyltransferase, partial [Spirochaetota bacterium]|nr:1-acyl-sn-glycerol-3-phosphate acyltransferase [Spirochaetota bacterium]